MPRHPSITGKPRPAVTLSVSLQLERLCQTRPCAGQPGQMTGAQERLGVLAGPAQGCGGPLNRSALLALARTASHAGGGEICTELEILNSNGGSLKQGLCCSCMKFNLPGAGTNCQKAAPNRDAL